MGAPARVLFAGCWIAGQAALVLSAPSRPDRIFGFHMFPEASTIEIHLTREVGGKFVAAPHGEWRAPDRSGYLHDFSWRDRVHDRTLGALDTRIFASYGGGAQLARLQHALDDMIDHIPDDAETTRLRAETKVWRNGRDPFSVTLVSGPRSSR